jgi:hypothetical protein
LDIDELAGIEYAGHSGATRDCIDAVLRYLQYGETITQVRVLSAASTHALLITYGVGDVAAIKSGFSSGYGGEGPRGFSYILALFHALDVDVIEHVVDEALIARLDASALTRNDIDSIEADRSTARARIHDYIDERHLDQPDHLWRGFPTVIPFAIIDSRLNDLAIEFWQNPDACLLRAYRRLEDAVRDRTGVQLHGSKLFATVFNPSKPLLAWSDGDPQDQAGRMQMFVGAYATYRNPRAHREIEHHSSELLAELLVVNHLFRLESVSRLAQDGIGNGADPNHEPNSS